MKEPCIWLNEAEVDGLADCGCSLNRDYKSSDNPAFFFCPLHEAAEELMEAAKEAIADLEDLSESGMKSILGGFPSIRIMEKLFNALAKAEGGSK